MERKTGTKRICGWLGSPSQWYSVEARESHSGQIAVQWKPICSDIPKLPEDVLAKIPASYGRGGWAFDA
jgi:hypothetical protein